MNQTNIQVLYTKHIHLLEACIANLGNARKHFRYFDKRPLSIIQNHLVTAIILCDGEAIGYGHLDNDNDIIWLGIAIAENFQGKGLGKKMMQFLIDNAIKNNVQKISLTVDEDNFAAVKLYEHFGFSSHGKINNGSLIMHCTPIN